MGTLLAIRALPAQGVPSSDLLRAVPLTDAGALSERVTFVVMADAAGFLWSGTNDGLVRFDGYRTTTWRHDPRDSTSLANNTVRRLLEDPTGNLWIRTESSLDRFDRTTGRFHHYPVVARELLLDHDRRVIVAAATGIFAYDPRGDSLVRLVQLDSTPGSEDPVWGVLQTADRRFWVTTASGRLGVTDGRHPMQWQQLPWRLPVLGYQDAAGALWVGHERGIGSFHPMRRDVVDLTASAGLAVAPVLQVRPAADGSIWVAGERSVVQLRLTPQGFAGRTVWSPTGLEQPAWFVAEDPRGVTWIAGGRGLLHVDPYRNPFRAEPMTAGSTTRPAAVMAVARDPRGRLWVGALGSGVVRADGGTGARVPDTPCGRDVWSLAWRAEQLWIGTSRGLCLWDSRTSLARSVGLRSDGKPPPAVHALVVDASGTLWVGSSGGLYSVRGAAVTYHALAAEPPAARVEGLALASGGRLLVGTSNSNVYVVTLASREVRRVATGDAPSLRGSEGFWALAEAADQRFLAGGDRGLYQVDPATGHLVALGAAQGVRARTVYALARDATGSHWMTTEAGLVRLRPSPGGYTSRTFTAADGISIREFNRRAVAIAGDTVSVGGMGGIIEFVASRLRDNPVPPPVRIVAAERLGPDGATAIPTHGLAAVRLAPGQRGLALEFAALGATDARRVQYRYRLDKVDDAWVTADPERRVRYPRLAPGRYDFEVRATTDGLAESVLRLPVIVAAPWWVSWWFRLAAVALALWATVVSVRRVATRRLRERIRHLEVERRVQGERERIAADLHDHVGGQLATLMSGIELAQLSEASGQHEVAARHLQSLAGDARETLNHLREAVWSLGTSGLTASGLADYIAEAVERRQRYQARPAVTVRPAIARDRALTSAEAMHLFRIAQEAVTNALKHAQASRIEVVVEAREDHRLALTIRDDGQHAVAASADGGGFGVRGMAARAAHLGASFTWGPGDAGGTCVTVVTPPSPP